MKILFIKLLAIIFYGSFGTVLLLADTPDHPVTEYIIVEGKKIKVEDGMDLSNKDLQGLEIHRELGVLRNVKFDGSDLSGVDFSETEFHNCSFRRIRRGSEVLVNYTSLGYTVEDCDFTDADISSGCFPIPTLWLTKEQLMSTISFKHKRLVKAAFMQRDYSDVDFSNFYFEDVWFDMCPLNGAKLDNAVIKDTSFWGISLEQLKSTKSFKEGNVIGCRLHILDTNGKADFSGINFFGCYFLGHSKDSEFDFTDSVISGCLFGEKFAGLTLENVKSTWNYKHGHMEGITFPKRIQEALDAEKAEKEKAVK